MEWNAAIVRKKRNRPRSIWRDPEMRNNARVVLVMLAPVISFQLLRFFSWIHHRLYKAEIGRELHLDFIAVYLATSLPVLGVVSGCRVLIDKEQDWVKLLVVFFLMFDVLCVHAFLRTLR